MFYYRFILFTIYIAYYPVRYLSRMDIGRLHVLVVLDTLFYTVKYNTEKCCIVERGSICSFNSNIRSYFTSDVSLYSYDREDWKERRDYVEIML